MAEVSVVIPTRNRAGSLLQLLSDLLKQVYPLKEVIIVDSSDEPMDQEELQGRYPLLNIRYYSSEASVCIQRNIGIGKASAPYVFLCDDDLTLPEDYVSVLMKYLDCSGAGAASGLVMQKYDGAWCYQYPPSSFGRLLFAFVFQHSLWGDVNNMKVTFWQQPLYKVIKKFYKHRKNSVSLAGWPVITEFELPVFRVDIYGLGASVVKKEWLLNSPYDEVLEAHGIGDNYGVAMGFPDKSSIHVVGDAKVYHHQSEENRLENHTSYYRRLLALHYFMKKNARFRWWNRSWFIWSLVGNLILFWNRREHFNATRKALSAVLRGKNPYWQAFRKSRI